MCADNGYYIFVILFVFNLATCRTRDVYSNTWVVQVDGGLRGAERIAAEKDLTLLGQVGSLEGFYLLKHDSHAKRSRRDAPDITLALAQHPNVIWTEQQIVKRRVRRDYNPHYNDPDYGKQWFLHNTDSVFGGYDHNVLPVWGQGVTGKGVVTSILDDGIEYTHPDLKANYDSAASYDYLSNDPDPAPRPTWNDVNKHGTRCAGEVAAAGNNSVCGVGVAPGSKVGGVRMLDPDFADTTDAVEASSLSLSPHYIDLYSSSWGPDDDGRTVDGPATLARKAFADGVQKGRGGLGSIFVWASGNGGRVQDSCSCDGYTNSIYTLSISSATEHGTSPWYSEYCASTLATTFSSGSYDMRKIVTTDLHGRCTDSHTGTSASAPLAAGILALALEVNRNLTWRDVQHLVVRTSSNAKLQSGDFVVNAVGRKVSHKFGYGLLDALALVNLARKWKTVPAQHICREIPEAQQRPIPGTGTLKVTIDATACSDNEHHVRYLEHVQVVITLTFTRRGDLTIKLISPCGTASVLLPQRRKDYSSSGFTDWEFMSTHTWGEDPNGTWTLEIKNHGASHNTGTLKNWYLVLYGTSEPITGTGDGNASCPSGFFAGRDTKEYKPCHSLCTSCTGPSPSECVSCIQGLFRLGSPVGTCVAGCPEGTYTNTTSGICENCPVGCASCSHSSALECHVCSEGFVMHQSQCLIRCPEGTFPRHSNSCVPCNPACQTCFGEGSDHCLSCSLPNLLAGSACVTKCPGGMFHSQTTHTCESCHTTCETCSGPCESDCHSCKDGWLLNGSECKAPCPSGMFKGIEGCQSCHPVCHACNGPSEKDCLSCSEIKFLDLQTKQCSYECPDGYFGDLETTHCMPCSPGCTECKNKVECLSCGPGLLLVGNYCQTQCPAGQYHGKTNSCEPCDGMCKDCVLSSNNCIQCQGHEVLSDGKCVSICPVGTFLLSDTKSCAPCHSSCKSCTGPNADQCTGCGPASVMATSRCLSSCPSDYYFDREVNSCQPCDYYCSACEGGNGLRNCTRCKPPFVLYKYYCIRECPKHGWVLDSSRQKCIKCHSSCARCIGPTSNDCIACSKSDTSLVGFSCKKECPYGTFPNQETGLCERCHPTCETCSGACADNCLSCSKDLVQSESKGMCNSVCPEGQFSKEEKCEKCHPSCRSCNGPDSSNCLNCPNGKAFYNFTCVNSCPDGTFLTDKYGIRQCQPCHPVCHSCYGPSTDNCLLCKSPLFLERGMCIVRCSPKHSIDEETQSCHPQVNKCKQLLAKGDNAFLKIIHKNGVLEITFAVLFVIIVAVLVHKFRSKRRVSQYHQLRATFTGRTENEFNCNVTLIHVDSEGDRDL